MYGPGASVVKRGAEKTQGTEDGGHKVKKDGRICYFQVAELLGSKEADGGPMKCKFNGLGCPSHHIASLKEITRAEAKSILEEAPSGRVKQIAQEAGLAAKGTYKDE